MSPYRVKAEWDPEAEVWVASSEDVPGLATGADTFETLVEKLKVVIPELLEVTACWQLARPMSPSRLRPNVLSTPSALPNGRQFHAARQSHLEESGCTFVRQGNSRDLAEPDQQP